MDDAGGGGAPGAGPGKPRARPREDDAGGGPPVQRPRDNARHKDLVATMAGKLSVARRRYENALHTSRTLNWFRPVPHKDLVEDNYPHGLIRAYRVSAFPTTFADFDDRKTKIDAMLADDPTGSPFPRAVFCQCDIIVLTEGPDSLSLGRRALTPEDKLKRFLSILEDFSSKCFEWNLKAWQLVEEENKRRDTPGNRARLIDLCPGTGNPGRSWHSNPFVGARNGGADGSTPMTLLYASGPTTVPGYPAWNLNQSINPAFMAQLRGEILRPTKNLGLELLNKVCSNLSTIDVRNLCIVAGIQPSVLFDGHHTLTDYAIASLPKSADQLRPAKDSPTLGKPVDVVFHDVPADALGEFTASNDADASKWPGAATVTVCFVPIQTVSKDPASNRLVVNLFLMVYDPGARHTQLVFNAVKPETGAFRGKNAPVFSTSRLMKLCELGIGLHVPFELPHGSRVAHDIDYRACHFVKISGHTRVAHAGEPHAVPTHTIELSMRSDRSEGIGDTENGSWVNVKLMSGTGRSPQHKSELVGGVPGISGPFYATESPIARGSLPGFLFPGQGYHRFGPPMRPRPLDFDVTDSQMAVGSRPNLSLKSLLVLGGSVLEPQNTACLMTVSQLAHLVWVPAIGRFLELPEAIREQKIKPNHEQFTSWPHIVTVSDRGTTLRYWRAHYYNKKGPIVASWQLRGRRRVVVRKPTDPAHSPRPDPPIANLPVGLLAGDYSNLRARHPASGQAIDAFLATPNSETIKGAATVAFRRNHPFYRLDPHGWKIFTEEATSAAYKGGLVDKCDWELVDTVIGQNSRVGLSLVVSPPFHQLDAGRGRELDLSGLGTSRYGYRAAAPNPSTI